MRYRTLDKDEALWDEAARSQMSEPDVPFSFIKKAQEMGFGFHKVLENVVCDYTHNGKVHNLLYTFLPKRCTAYSPKNLTALSVEATGTPDAAEAFMARLENWKLPNPAGTPNGNYQFLLLDLIYDGECELINALHAFLIDIKGRKPGITADEFLSLCHASSIAELSPEELIDFTDRYMERTTALYVHQLIGHPFGHATDWPKVAALISEAYEKGLIFHWEYIMGADVRPLPEGYEEKPENLGIQYHLDTEWPPKII